MYFEAKHIFKMCNSVKSYLDTRGQSFKWNLVHNNTAPFGTPLNFQYQCIDRVVYVRCTRAFLPQENANVIGIVFYHYNKCDEINIRNVQQNTQSACLYEYKIGPPKKNNRVQCKFTRALWHFFCGLTGSLLLICGCDRNHIFTRDIRRNGVQCYIFLFYDVVVVFGTDSVIANSNEIIAQICAWKEKRPLNFLIYAFCRRTFFSSHFLLSPSI